MIEGKLSMSEGRECDYLPDSINGSLANVSPEKCSKSNKIHYIHGSSVAGDVYDIIYMIE